MLLHLDDAVARAGQVRQRRAASRSRRRARPPRSGRATPRASLEVARRAARAGSPRRRRSSSRAPLLERPLVHRLAVPEQHVEGDELGRDLGRQLADAALGRMEAHLHRVEVERAVARDHDLAVERGVRRQQLAERRAARGSSAAAAGRCATRARARRRRSRARRGSRPTSARTASLAARAARGRARPPSAGTGSHVAIGRAARRSACRDATGANASTSRPELATGSHGRRRSSDAVAVTGRRGAITPLGARRALDAGDAARRRARAASTSSRPSTRASFPVRIAAEVKGFDPTTVASPKEARRLERNVLLALGAAPRGARRRRPRRTSTRRASASSSARRSAASSGSSSRTTSCASAAPTASSPCFLPNVLVDSASRPARDLARASRARTTRVVSACATGSHAVGEARRADPRGDADAMLAGGTEACIHPLILAGFCAMRGLAAEDEDPPRASRPFDATRAGFVMGEGACVAPARGARDGAERRGATIYAEVLGYGASNDAHHLAQPEPEAIGVAEMMRARARARRRRARAGRLHQRARHRRRRSATRPRRRRSRTSSATTPTSSPSPRRSR